MLLGNQAGQAYSEDEIEEIVRLAGMENIYRTPYVGPMPSGIMVGTRGPASSYYVIFTLHRHFCNYPRVYDPCLPGKRGYVRLGVMRFILVG